MYNHLNPFDRGFTGFYIECHITFQERGKPLSRLPLHASQQQLVPNIKPGDSCLSNGRNILLENPELSEDLRKDYVSSGDVKLVDYRLIGTTSNLHLVISDELAYEYANHLLSRMQDLLKESARSYSVANIHITKKAYSSLIETGLYEKAEVIDKSLVKLNFLSKKWSFSDYDAVFINLKNLPWSDSNLQMTVGYDLQTHKQNLNSLFEKSLVDLLLLAGEAGVKQIKLDPIGQIIKGLPRFIEE